MAIDFPDNPIIDEIFLAPNLATYQWDGDKWNTRIRPGYACCGANPGTQPPANPTAGTFWFNTEEGRLYTWYDDGDSIQWVDVTGT